MLEGTQSLSEKEKEALRLLVNGYDAKSMARQLGLSVHTVNERLRDARRKLAVSSSREAARLLRDVEAATPEILGDKALGDAPAAAAGQMIRQPAQGDGKWRRAGWIFGGLAMTFSLALLAVSAMSGTSQAPTLPLSAAPAISPTSASEMAAIDAAQQFLTLTDRDDWTASWQETHQSFKLLNTVEWWSEVSKSLRAKVGTPKSRALLTANFAPAPPNGYWTLQFKADYSKKGSAVETVSLAWEKDRWRVASIMVE